MPHSSLHQFVRRLLSARHMTMMDMCQLLGYRSQTSLVRIMQGKVRHESLDAFAQKLRSCRKISLTADESRQLDELVELHNTDSSTAQALTSIRRLLCGLPEENTEPPQLKLSNGTSVNIFTHFCTAKIRRVFILNCEHVSIFHDLALLMEQQGFTIEHYMFSSPAVLRSVHTLQAIMPVVFNEGYTGWVYRIPKEPSNTTRGLMTSDMMIVERDSDDGRLLSETIVFNSNSTGIVLQQLASIDMLQQLLPAKSQMLTIKIDPSDTGDSLAYLDFCADLEHNHAVYRLKPDVGMDQIPVDILKAAVADSAPDELLSLLDQLADCFSRRHLNLLERRQPQYHIMKRKAIMQFAQTGRMSDHLWCCRAFTMEERAEIFTYIRDVLMTRPSIHIRFLKDDDFLLEQEIVLYEGVGLSLIKPDTNYNWTQTHAEVLITHHEFLTTFKHFYTYSLLRYHVDSEETSLMFLNQMIDYCHSNIKR